MTRASQHTGLRLMQRLQSCWALLLWSSSIPSTGRLLDQRWAATTVKWNNGGAGSADLPAQGTTLTTQSTGLPVLPPAGVGRHLHVTLPPPASLLDPSKILFTGLWRTSFSSHPVSAVGTLEALRTAAAHSPARVPEAPPAEFDPGAYLDYNPHLAEDLDAHRDQNMSLGQAAWRQYQELRYMRRNITAGVRSLVRYGFGNLTDYSQYHVYCHRIPVVLSYSSYMEGGFGLCNQVYSHIAAWVLAAQLGADVLVPPAAKRGSYATRGDHSSAAFDELFSWPHTRELLQGLGVQARMYPSLDVKPRHMYRDAAAYVRQQLQNLGNPLQQQERSQLWQVLRRRGQLDVTMPDLAYRTRGAMHMRDRAAALVLQTANNNAASTASNSQQPSPPGAGARAADGALPPCSHVPLVHLHLGTPLFALRTVGDALAAHIASRLRFSAAVEQRAAEVLRAMAARNITRFHGIHLRVEEESTYNNEFGGEDGALKAYVDGALRIGLGAPEAERLPIYVASGLLTYKEGIPLMIKVKRALELLGSEVLTKEDLLLPPQPPLPDGGAPPQRGNVAPRWLPRQLPGLHTEQQAAVDILVLERASLFVGLGRSSLSWFVQERRLLAGKQPNTSALVGTVFPTLADGARFVSRI